MSWGNPFDLAMQGVDQAIQGFNAYRSPGGQANALRQQRLANIPRNQPYNRTPMQAGGSARVGTLPENAGGGQIKGNLNTYQGPPIYLGPDREFAKSFEQPGPVPGSVSTGEGARDKYLAADIYDRRGQLVAGPSFEKSKAQGPEDSLLGGGGGGYSPEYVRRFGGGGGQDALLQDPRTKAALDVYRTGAREREEQLNQRMRDSGLGASGAKAQALARQGREHGLGEAALLGQLGESNRSYGLAERGQDINLRRLLADIEFRNRELSRGGGYSMWNRLPAPRVG